MIDYDYWFKLHPRGSCVVRHSDRDLVYVTIPKNASTSIKMAWGKSSANFLDNTFNNPQYVVVLRDPLSRWISGMAQTLHTQERKYWDPVIERIVGDNHTVEQYRFLEGLEHKDILWFKTEELASLEQFIGQRIGIEYATTGNNLKEIATKYVLDKLEDVDFKQRVIDFYKIDYMLYNNVNYYKAEINEH
jgi:hypothetical protein